MELEFASGVELEQPGAELALEHSGDGVHGEEPAGLFGTGPGVLGGEAAAKPVSVLTFDTFQQRTEGEAETLKP
jgi:hypothetical protein